MEARDAMAESATLDRSLRLRVYEHVVERGHPPTVEQLATDFVLHPSEVLAALQRLEAGRALILTADKTRIRVAPPFSAVPTPFRVETPRGSWWGNCAWEALGIPATLGCDALIRTTSGACGGELSIDVNAGHPDPRDLVMHVAVPARRWWDDVGFTCGTILFFRTPAEVDSWCERSGIARGAVLSMDQAWLLAQRWYAGRLSSEWRRLTREEARASLTEAGLTGPFWELD
jgi:hypothetical protein